jgi:hypothetical protein
MVTRCLFGIFVFGSNSSLIYRFVTDDLFSYLRNYFIDRGYTFDENSQVRIFCNMNLFIEIKLKENRDVNFSIDDVFAQHFSTLINFYTQTAFRKSPIRQITLESNIQIFFDQVYSIY